MRFKPGQSVPLYFEDGTAISARPFYYQTVGRKGMGFYLITEDGAPVRSTGAGPDVFTLGNTGRRLYLERPRPVAELRGRVLGTS